LGRIVENGKETRKTQKALERQLTGFVQYWDDDLSYILYTITQDEFGATGQCGDETSPSVRVHVDGLY